MTGIERLEQWCRKGYYFEIKGGGFYQPGDGVYVKLSAAGRSVDADDASDPIVTKDEAGEDEYTDRSIDQLIELALDRWHADTSLKWFEALVSAVPGDIDFGVAVRGWCKDSSMILLRMDTEEAVRDFIKAKLGLEGRRVTVWEKSQEQADFFIGLVNREKSATK